MTTELALTSAALLGEVRPSNVLLVGLCVTAIGVAVSMAWRWGNLPVVAERVPIVATAKTSGADALRTLACVFTAAFVAGGLVVGFGGRLVMRVLAATSGTAAQGRLTDAGESVGEISIGGSLSFFIFGGILVPLVASIAFVPLRRLLPNRAWCTGLVFGVILLGTFGVDDPLSPDNVDFVLLSPLWLAVALVAATALLYGMTFAAITARLDASVVTLSQLGARGRWRYRIPYASLVSLLLPILAIPALVYVGGRAISHGRIGRLLDGSTTRRVGEVAVALIAVGAAGLVVQAATDII